jgi:TonB-dependent SusC/RagA subfamily outer membrane receptor
MVTVGAQLPRAAADSVALLPALQLSAASTGASVAVIDSAMIASSGARTLSELLLARVPGLSVRHRGGTEADGFEISSRGMGPVAGGPAGVIAPLLIIDGVMADAHQGLRVPGTTTTISRLDDLTPAEVERIEVLRGPAASALYGVGAAAGVIIVTTRRGDAGPLRLDVNAGAGLTELAADFPANYELTNGTPGQFCNPRIESTQTVASCTPMTLYSWNPLEQASPFRLGHSLKGAVELSGTARGTRVFGGVAAERVNGVTGDDRQSRLGVHGSVERALPGRLTVSAQGSYLQRDATAPTRGDILTTDNVIALGMLGSAYKDSVGGYLSPYLAIYPMVEQQAPSLSRVVGALRVGWNPAGWLSVNALAGQDHARESAISITRVTNPLGTTEPYAFSSDRWTGGTMHVGAMTRYAAVANVAMATYLAYDDVRTHDQATDSSGSGPGAPSSYYSYSWSRRRMHSQEATVRQRASWGDVFDVNAGARFSVGRGVIAPLGPDAARSVDASLRLPSPRPDIQLRLRGAAGFVPLMPPGMAYRLYGGAGGYTDIPLRSRRGEREGGIDAAFGTRARVELTWFRAGTRNLVLGEPVLTPTSSLNAPWMGDLSNSGIEAVASAQLFQGSRVGWRSTVTVGTLHDRITHTNLELLTLNSSVKTGYPLQGYWSRTYAWADTNADGLVAMSEVSGASKAYVGPSKPTLELGMQNAVTLPRGLTVTALLDYRHGQYRDNESETLRCRVAACQGIHDPSLSLGDQARWSAITRGIVRDIVPASYLRLRDVVVEWTPEARVHGMQRLTVRVVGQDLLTWTNYDGVDPEVGETPVTALEAPSELFQSPLPRRVRVEVKMGVR